MIELKEKQLIGKRSDQSLCEDGIFINENFVAVIDGVTSKGKQKWHQRLTSGCYAKEIIVNELHKMPRNTNPDTFFTILDHALRTAYTNEVEQDDVTEWLRACIVVYSDFHSQIWSVGDCACLVNDCLFSDSKKIDTILSELRSFVIYHNLKNGGQEKDIWVEDVGRAAISPFLKMQLTFENDYDTPWGYPVLNGHGFDIRGCKIYNVKKGDTIILASDGYPKLYNNLETSEQELAFALENDPLCYKTYPSTKGLVPGNASFDDRSYIKFVIS